MGYSVFKMIVPKETTSGHNRMYLYTYTEVFKSENGLKESKIEIDK